MPIKKSFIPRQNAKFYGWQGNFVNLVVLNQVAWGIPVAAVAALVARRAQYEPLYLKIQNKNTRTRTDVLAHNEMRAIYEKEIRAFVRNYCGPLSNTDKSDLVLTIRDIEPTPRGKIDVFPYVYLKGIGGGDIQVRVRTEEDKTNASMHPLADEVECKYDIVQTGDVPTDDPESCRKTHGSKKARFIIPCGVKNAGQSFYGYFRWVNKSNPHNSGPWTTKTLGVVIA